MHTPLDRTGSRHGALALRLVALAVLTAGTAASCSPTSDATQPTTAETRSTPTAPSTSHGAPHNTDDLGWGPAPTVFPPGAELAVLQGDPSEAGAVFTVRLRMPDGYVLPPHFHPEDEHVTVIQGKFLVGLGDVVDDKETFATLQRGGFITAPKAVHHWAKARGVTVVQVHGIGPFQVTYVDEQGDPLPR